MLAAATLALLILFHVLRLLAEHCIGNVCAFSIPVSLFLPLLILVVVAVTGFAALPAASRRHQRSGWPRAIGVSTLLVALLPVAALAYSLTATI